MNKNILIVLGIVLIGAAIFLFGGSHYGSVPLPSTAPNTAPAPASTQAGSFTLVPASGKEGAEINISYPNAAAPLPETATVTFHDGGEHGWKIISGGAGVYMTYDSTSGLSYTANATKSANGTGYSIMVPDGMCGYVVQSIQAPPAKPKILSVSINGPDGKPLSGTKPSNFTLECDKYTLKVTIKAVPDTVLPDGASQSTVTANLTVTGPAKFINGQKIPNGSKPIVLTTPLGLTMVHFNNSLGNIVPNPANVKTDLAGDAVVTVSSPDAGIDKVQAIASGIGDAIVNVYFKPKIVGVREDFVEPNSPTNYQISTIPANPKDLTFKWEIIRPAGPVCGSLTGPATGLALSKNGFFHGPTGAFPDGCPQDYEMATKIKVTVTDKDGQTDTKTFSARAFEGQGVVKL